jgi:hypothetical protein
MEKPSLQEQMRCQIDLLEIFGNEVRPSIGALNAELRSAVEERAKTF